MHELPSCLADVSQSWLCDALRDKVPNIRTMRISNLGDGIGQVSELGKVTVEDDAGQRHDMIVKTRTNVADMHRIGIDYGMYEREVNFYRELADQIPLRTPEIYFASWNPDSERVAIVMEFMDGWYSPNQIAGATRQETEKALRGLAGLTAAYWNSPLRGRLSWLGDSRADYYQNIVGDYRNSARAFVERFGQRLPPGTPDIVTRIGDLNPQILRAMAQGRYSLSHWDYRVENLFFKEGEDDVAVIDWQLAMWMKPGWDFAYLCFTNLSVENRRAWLPDLMSLYVEQLAVHGVRDYSADDLMQDIRLCLPGISAVSVVGGAAVDSNNARSINLLGTVAERTFSGIADLDCMTVIDALE